MSEKLKDFEKTQSILREGIIAGGFNEAIEEIYYTYKDVIILSLVKRIDELKSNKYILEEVTSQSFLNFIVQVARGKEFEKEESLFNYLYTIHLNCSFKNINAKHKYYEIQTEDFFDSKFIEDRQFGYLTNDNLELISDEYSMSDFFNKFKRYQELCYKLLKAIKIDKFKYKELMDFGEYKKYSEPALRQKYSRCLKHLKETYFQSLKN